MAPPAPAGPAAAPWADQAAPPPGPRGNGDPGQYGGPRGQQYAPPQDYTPQDYGQYAAQQGAPEYAAQQQGAPQDPASAPRRFRRGKEQPRRSSAGASAFGVDDTEITDDPMEAFSQRWRRRGAESDHQAVTVRKRLYVITGALAVVAIAAIVALAITLTGGKTGRVGFGSLVTTFLPGEVQQVPDACKAVSTATLSQYLPGGQPAVAFPPLNGGTDSQCTWTLDKAPVYRVIEVDVNAFSPSGLASGNGSATFAASDAYASDLQTMQKPPAGSDQPAAQTTYISGMGDSAFVAWQTFNRNGTVSYKATVFVRYHNVIVTSVVNALNQATTSKGDYGPVQGGMDTLKAAATQAAKEALAQIPK
jgi:hypothetical protein